MKLYRLIIAALLVAICLPLLAQEEIQHEEGLMPKRHKLGLYLGNSVVHEVHNNLTGKEQYVLAPTFGLDYEYSLSEKWAVGLYNEISFLNIDVETEGEEYVKRENIFLSSGVLVFEPVRHLAFFAGAGLETDQHQTFMIKYIGVEYAFIRCSDWDVSAEAGYINKDLYDSFNFGVVIGRRFGKRIASKH